MSPQYEFPHADISDPGKELFIRDIFFLNYHINHDKWDWFKYFDIINAHMKIDLYHIAGCQICEILCKAYHLGDAIVLCCLITRL